jgi:predicted transcriptional regulator
MKVPYTVRIEENIRKAIDEARWKLKLTKGQLVEEAIKEYLQRHCPEVYEEFLKKEGKQE